MNCPNCFIASIHQSDRCESWITYRGRHSPIATPVTWESKRRARSPRPWESMPPADMGRYRRRTVPSQPAKKTRIAGDMSSYRHWKRSRRVEHSIVEMAFILSCDLLLGIRSKEPRNSWSSCKFQHLGGQITPPCVARL